MNTSAVIARQYHHFERFCGRYHHSGGEPSHLGRALWRLYQGHLGGDMAGDLPAMERVLLLDHPAGWSTIAADWNKRSGSGNDGGPACFCHGPQRGHPVEISDRNAAEYGCEFAYILTRTELGEPAFHVSVIVPVRPSDPEPPSKLQVRTATRFVAEVALTGPEPKWGRIETEAAHVRRKLEQEAPEHWILL